MAKKPELSATFVLCFSFRGLRVSVSPFGARDGKKLDLSANCVLCFSLKGLRVSVRRFEVRGVETCRIVSNLVARGGKKKELSAIGVLQLFSENDSCSKCYITNCIKESIGPQFVSENDYCPNQEEQTTPF